MNKIKLVLIFVLLSTIALMFAAPITLTFRDTSQATKNLVWEQLPTYPVPTPTNGTYSRWVIQFYKSTDNVIDPLGSNGLPTGDDVVPTNAGSTGVLNFGPTGTSTWNAPSFIALDAIAVPDPNVVYHSSSNKVYIRIFNSNSIALADKYIEGTSLYTVLSAGGNVNYIPTYGWSIWKTKTVTPLISGAITSSTLNVSGVNVALTGDVTGNYTTLANGLYSFSVVSGSSITITPSKTGYSFVPASYSNPSVTGNLPGINFAMKDLDPNPVDPLTPTPTNGAVNVPVTIGQLQWNFTPSSDYAPPTEFKVYFPADAIVPVSVPYVPATTAYSTPIPLLGYGAMYLWKVVPWNSAKGQVAEGFLGTASIGSKVSKGGASAITWAFTTQPAIEWVNPGGSNDLDPGNSMGIVLFELPASAPAAILLTLIPISGLTFPGSGTINLDNAFAVNMNMNATGSTTLTVTVPPTGTWYVTAYYNGTWNHARNDLDTADRFPVMDGDPDRTVYFYNVPFTPGKSDVPTIFSEGGDPTLPVELSSFSAVLTSQYFINLTWVTESETQVSGFYIYRSEDSNYANALCLNSNNIVPATNTSQQQSYTMTDTEELEANKTYYYWLDSVDLGGSNNLHGPISATVTGQPIPELPEVSVMSSAYPNPFRMGTPTSINVNIKAGEKGTVSIYNVRGQLVESFKVMPGVNKITWNAKGCASGIYLQKLSTPSVNNTKKMVIIN